MSADAFRSGSRTTAGPEGAELVLRLALRSIDPPALRTEVHGWLAGVAEGAGIGVPDGYGPHARANDDLGLELYRLPERLLASVTQRDPAERARSWTTEIDLHDGGHLDLRLSVVEPPGIPPAPRRSAAFVERIVADPRHGVADVEPLLAVPGFADRATIAKFLALVDDPGRRLPVVAVSLPSSADPFELARRLAGAAHVVCLDAGGSLALTEAVGKWHSVFHGGVRTYPPGFTWKSPSRQAPLSLAARLGEVRDGLTWTERLVRAVLALASLTYRDRPFATVREFERHERLVHEASGSMVASVTKLGEEIAQLRAERDALRAELDERNLFVRELSAEIELLRRASKPPGGKRRS
jgi:hypothetical protein